MSAPPIVPTFAQMQAEANPWRPMSEAPETPGTHITVRSQHTYRWVAYKPDNRRRAGALGRWQRATIYDSWVNCARPEGEWMLVEDGA